jgi:hypothetical protein
MTVYETPENTNENEGFDYVDGALSRKYLLSRGTCCANDCQNCPWAKNDEYVELYEHNGMLYCPGRRYGEVECLDCTDQPCVLIWESGDDMQTVNWPDYDKGKLRTVLRELRDLGWIPPEDKLVRMPDGSLEPIGGQ